jgi:hypothetical protein
MLIKKQKRRDKYQIRPEMESRGFFLTLKNYLKMVWPKFEKLWSEMLLSLNFFLVKTFWLLLKEKLVLK